MQVSKIAQIASGNSNFGNKSVDFAELTAYLFTLPGVQDTFNSTVENANRYAKSIEEKGFEDVNIEILIVFNESFNLWVSVEWDEGRKTQFFAPYTEYDYSRSIALADRHQCDNKDRTRAQLLKFREYEMLKTVFQDEVKRQVEDAKKQKKFEDQQKEIENLRREIVELTNANKALSMQLKDK